MLLLRRLARFASDTTVHDHISAQTGCDVAMSFNAFMHNPRAKIVFDLLVVHIVETIRFVHTKLVLACFRSKFSTF